MSKVYAYVTSECCTLTRAVLPGSEVNGKPVSRHGDYSPWTLGKRDTLAWINREKAGSYPHRAAEAVAYLHGWLEDY